MVISRIIFFLFSVYGGDHTEVDFVFLGDDLNG